MGGGGVGGVGRETHRGEAIRGPSPWLRFCLEGEFVVTIATISRIAEQVNVEGRRQKSDIVSGVFANLIPRGEGGYLHHSAGT